MHAFDNPDTEKCGRLHSLPQFFLFGSILLKQNPPMYPAGGFGNFSPDCFESVLVFLPIGPDGGLPRFLLLVGDETVMPRDFAFEM